MFWESKQNKIIKERKLGDYDLSFFFLSFSHSLSLIFLNSSSFSVIFVSTIAFGFSVTFTDIHMLYQLDRALLPSQKQITTTVRRFWRQSYWWWEWWDAVVPGLSLNCVFLRIKFIGKLWPAKDIVSEA